MAQLNVRRPQWRWHTHNRRATSRRRTADFRCQPETFHGLFVGALRERRGWHGKVAEAPDDDVYCVYVLCGLCALKATLRSHHVTYDSSRDPVLPRDTYV